MIILDTALNELDRAGTPLRVGLVGAGFAGKGLALQLLTGRPGLRLSAISNRTIGEAVTAVRQADPNLRHLNVETVDQLESAIAKDVVAVTSNPFVLCESPNIDVIVEATGEIEFAARVCLEAFRNRKHVVVLNAELDATLGPILTVKARQAGVMYCQADGDQPAVIMNLVRYVSSIGFEPILCGNIKTLQDCRRTPGTQLDFATKVWQRPKFITSFADGTKISQEMCTVANATGFRVGKRGMHGPRCDHVDKAVNLFDVPALRESPIVDYILGAQPSFGVFVLAFSDHPIKQRYMKVYKMGDGPVYTFYTPFHLSPLEAPNSVARVALFRDAPCMPIGGPVCEVITLTKRDLKAGETLDGIGGFCSYGTIDNSDVARRDGLLPMGLSEGCVLKHDLPIDTPIKLSDVVVPQGRVCDKLFAEQLAHFRTTTPRPKARVA